MKKIVCASVIVIAALSITPTAQTEFSEEYKFASAVIDDLTAMEASIQQGEAGRASVAVEFNELHRRYLVAAGRMEQFQSSSGQKVSSAASDLAAYYKELASAGGALVDAMASNAPPSRLNAAAANHELILGKMTDTVPLKVLSALIEFAPTGLAAVPTLSDRQTMWLRLSVMERSRLLQALTKGFGSEILLARKDRKQEGRFSSVYGSAIVLAENLTGYKTADELSR